MKKSLLAAATGCAAAALLCSGAARAQEPSASTRPPVSSASEIDFPPFSVVDDRGRADGFSVQLLRAALGAMGREVTFRTGTWEQVRGWLERGKVQALPLVGRTPEREALFDFTFALRELPAGRHDAVVMQRLVALRLIQEEGLGNLRVADRPVEGFRQDFCFAVREGDRNTLALLNEGLALAMADGTYRYLHARWFAALEIPSECRIVVGGDHNFPPYEYLDERGRPAGSGTG
jgi:two-component system sensor histidine kinase EvgS